MRAGRALLGLVRGARRQRWRTAAGDARSPRQPSIATGATTRPITRSIMKALYGLSWRAFHRCTCTGPARDLHPIPVTGRHTTLPLFARESTAFRFPAILFAALLVGLVYRFARRSWGCPARRRRGGGADARAAALLLPRADRLLRRAHHDHGLRGRATRYWKSLRIARWGILRGVVFGLALGVKHNAWLMPFFLIGHYLWMRRGDLRAPPACRRAAGVRVDAGAGAAHLLRCTGPGCGWPRRAHAQLRAAPPRARALQLRVPRPELEPAAHHRRPEAAARDRPFVATGLPCR